VKTASEMTYTVSGGALNCTQSNPISDNSKKQNFCQHFTTNTT